MKLPRINLITIIAGAMSLVSLTLPWWGFSGLLPFVGIISFQWSLFSSPTISTLPEQFVRDLYYGSIIILVLSVISAISVFVGSIRQKNKLLLASFFFSLSSIVLYPVVVTVAINNGCGQACTSIGMTSPVGTASGVTWGLQSGFYLFVASTIFLMAGTFFHRIFMEGPTQQNIAEPPVAKDTGRKHRYCFNCGSLLPSGPVAKFCPNCANPLQS